MKKTLQTIQTLLDDIKGDLNLLRLTSVYNKLERVSQLFESVVRHHKKLTKATNKMYNNGHVVGCEYFKSEFCDCGKLEVGEALRELETGKKEDATK